MNVTCNQCGWVYFQVSRKHAENEVKEFNVFFHSQPKTVQDMYGSPSDIRNYEYCWCKNHYKNFRDSIPGDCPDGCTLSPIIDRNE